MDKKFLVVVVVVLIAFGAILFSSKKQSNTDTKATASVTNHTAGAGKKNVELIEYGDFQCPVCGAYFPIIEEIRQKYGDDIKFVYRNFPLDALHQNARAAHRSAEAASAQGKFWEMYQQLYENQNDWSQQTNAVPIFESYAQKLGLNLDQYKKDFASEITNNLINADLASGQALKITGTPGLVVNGKLIENPRRDFASFSKIIDDAITEANKGAATTAPAPVPTP